MEPIIQSFAVRYEYPVHFTEGLFHADNPLLTELLSRDGATRPRKLFFVLDSGVADHHPDLPHQIEAYCEARPDLFKKCGAVHVVPGGEACKNDQSLVDAILEATHIHGIDRHAYILVIGGGSVLDMAGFAASIAHRGIRLIRIPTTVLAQNDAGVGVKNGVNAFGKKNYVGNFAPPYAILNDARFLETLEDRDWRAGISEAIKVALIKDAPFFERIQGMVPELNARVLPAMQELIYDCAALHLNHIASGDPFEMGSSRPLDFGHWAAHKLEQLTQYRLRHGEAVAIGIALDVTYAMLKGMLAESAWQEILTLLRDLEFSLFEPELVAHIDNPDHPRNILHGLNEFREHLGGDLCIMLLRDIGVGEEVFEIDLDMMIQAARVLETQMVRA